MKMVLYPFTISYSVIKSNKTMVQGRLEWLEQISQLSYKQDETYMIFDISSHLEYQNFF